MFTRVNMATGDVRPRAMADPGADGKETSMAIGPVQLLVLAFDQPNFQGEVLGELDRLKESDVVRVIDAVVVHKDAEGNVEVVKRSDLSDDEAAEFGAVVGALVGLGAAGLEGAEAGAEAGAEGAAEGVDVFPEEDAWDVVEDIPNDSAAALVLLEHRWAIPLRDALVRAGGVRVADGFIHPLDLVAVGMIAADEANALAGTKS
jgi:uncharacterized membrane protein